MIEAFTFNLLAGPEGLLPIIMGVATGGDAGDVSPRFEIPGDVPQKSRFLKKIFRIFAITFGFSNISKTKWAKSEEKSEFGGGWF